MDTAGNAILTTIENNGIFESLLVRVRFADDRLRTYGLAVKDPSVRQLKKLIGEKENLSAPALVAFDLYLVTKHVEFRLRPSQSLSSAVKNCARWTEEYSHVQNLTECSLVFKRAALFPISKEKFIFDESALKMFYGEVKANVLNGRYPCTANDAIALAALHLQIANGDYSPTRHPPGSFSKNLPYYLPQPILADYRPQDLEARLTNEYMKHSGKSTLKATLAYLAIARRWVFYGSIFFSVCKSVPNDGDFKQRVENWLLGVNENGIYILDVDKQRIVMTESFASLAWENNPQDTLAIEYGPENNAKEMVLLSPQAKLIDATFERAVENLEKMIAHAEGH